MRKRPLGTTTFTGNSTENLQPLPRKDAKSPEKRPTGWQVTLSPWRSAQEYTGSSLWCWNPAEDCRVPQLPPVEGNRSIPFPKQPALVVPMLSPDTDQTSNANQ